MRTIVLLAALLVGCVDEPLECGLIDHETGECLELDSTEQATLGTFSFGITCICSSGSLYCKNCTNCTFYYTGRTCTP
jgi:hypothetical protein